MCCTSSSLKPSSRKSFKSASFRRRPSASMVMPWLAQPPAPSYRAVQAVFLLHAALLRTSDDPQTPHPHRQCLRARLSLPRSDARWLPASRADRALRLTRSAATVGSPRGPTRLSVRWRPRRTTMPSRSGAIRLVGIRMYGFTAHVLTHLADFPTLLACSRSRR